MSKPNRDITTWEEFHVALYGPYYLTERQITGACKLLLGALQGAEQKIKDLEDRVQRLETETPNRG